MLAILAGVLLSANAGEIAPVMALVPAGRYQPLFRAEKASKELPIAAFQLDRHAVTNGEFLEFVRAHPQWQRSRVKRLFADAGYLSHWGSDLELGRAGKDQPVTHVSWFAAKAYASALGKRLPTTAEWELAANVGFSMLDGSKDAEFTAELFRWYAAPTPAILPDATSARENLHGVRGLHGLIWEWTSDFNSALMTGDARGDTGLERDLFCGAGSLGAGDRSNYAAFMRYGLRSSLKASYTVHNLGFRCARD